ncbi:MAG: sensor histidine kinase [Actinobacteria bacterium]|nr:MAG: sensor histidine kinase [Actinomycetota bacterium]
MIWNWLRRHPYLADTVIVLGLGVAYIGNELHQNRYGIELFLAVLQVAPLLLRRRFPAAVLVIVVSAASLYTVVTSSHIVPLPTAIAAYTVAAQLERRRSLRLTAASAAAFALVSLSVGGFGPAIAGLIPFAAAWVFGDNLGTRRAYTSELEEKADRLEREREVEAARAVAEEQARIARELHDVIAHNLSVMVVQAAAANDVFDARPDRAREALRTIEATGRTALGELRRLLEAVRGDAEFAPQPGLDALDALVSQVRSSGVDVAVKVEGDPRPLPPALDLSAYRVVQEALTNTLKHAGATHADVSLRYGDDALDVEVRDNGAGIGNGGGSGQGLIGMRERVVIFGGSLQAGPADGGGYTVAARFLL